jgi:hypothetical protein
MTTVRAKAGIIGAVLAIAAGVGATAFQPTYAPRQPIDFNHRDHVGGDRLDCELCHSGVRRARFAGMPPVERCMGCHRYVLPQNPGVAALHRYWDAGKPIPWIAVYSLPRFVHFSHEAHLLAHVDCQRCHGDVAAMNRVARVAPLTMGWCVDCHRSTGASRDCLTCHH